MPRKPGRDYSRENARREARARALGFRSDYERRLTQSQARGAEERRQASGHAGPAAMHRAVEAKNTAHVTYRYMGDRMEVIVLKRGRDGKAREQIYNVPRPKTLAGLRRETRRIERRGIPVEYVTSPGKSAAA